MLVDAPGMIEFSSNTNYTLGALLGEGGMGRVYAAEDAHRSPVAVKLLHAKESGDPAMIARLGAEARAAQRVSHGNVVRVHDYGITSDGTPFLVMDRVPGITLREMIRSTGPLPLSRIRRIAMQVLAGLAAIHHADLVHGDMKSENIIIESSAGDEKVTIVDFGLARPQPTRRASHRAPILSGTPEYMAPELIHGESITAATDLYAVGVIVYEMLTGTTPFSGGSVATICTRHLHDEVVPPSLRCRDRVVPRSLECVILRALEKVPGARYHSAELLAVALKRGLGVDAVDTPSAPSTYGGAFSTEAATRDWGHPRRVTITNVEVLSPIQQCDNTVKLHLLG